MKKTQSALNFWFTLYPENYRAIVYSDVKTIHLHLYPEMVVSLRKRQVEMRS